MPEVCLALEALRCVMVTLKRSTPIRQKAKVGRSSSTLVRVRFLEMHSRFKTISNDLKLDIFMVFGLW
jgi:hypothetical protein